MKEQNKELFDNKYQLRKTFLNIDTLMLKYNIKLNNQYNFKLVF